MWASFTLLGVQIKKTISLVAWEHATKTNLFRILKHTYKEFISKWIFQEE